MITRLLLLFSLLTTMSCAYGYAGQEAKTRTDPRDETKTNTRVVTMKEKDDGDEKKPDDDPPEPEKNTSPCGIPSFEIYYFTGSTKVTKTIDCAERAVSDIQRTPMGETTYVDAKAAGLPEGTWYILVDPKGIRANYLNNDHLLKLSREFEIEYFGRDASRDLLVYLFKEELE